MTRPSIHWAGPRRIRRPVAGHAAAPAARDRPRCGRRGTGADRGIAHRGADLRRRHPVDVQPVEVAGARPQRVRRAHVLRARSSVGRRLRRGDAAAEAEVEQRRASSGAAPPRPRLAIGCRCSRRGQAPPMSSTPPSTKAGPASRSRAEPKPGRRTAARARGGERGGGLLERGGSGASSMSSAQRLVASSAAGLSVGARKRDRGGCGWCRRGRAGGRRRGSVRATRRGRVIVQRRGCADAGARPVSVRRGSTASVCSSGGGDRSVSARRAAS